MSALATSFTLGRVQYTQMNRNGQFAIYKKWKPGQTQANGATYDIVNIPKDASGNESYPNSTNLGSRLTNTYDLKRATRVFNNSVKYKQLTSELFF